MKQRARLKKLICSILMGVPLASAPLMAQESFRVELGRDGETLGDIRPVFLKFDSRPLPAIAPEEVVRRYQRLFEISEEPDVRVDALNRLHRIRNRAGEELGYSAEQEIRDYREIIGSYEALLGDSSFPAQVDDLLYQLAKAHAMAGQPDLSIQRLTELVDLYPGSALAPEARFRIAEAAFSAGEFAEAEARYRRVVESAQHPELVSKARYMLGWSQFKQGAAAWPRAAETFMAVLDLDIPGAAELDGLSGSAQARVGDSFRILAHMARQSGGTESLSSWLGNRSPGVWHYLLYDRLADLHAFDGRYRKGVQVNQAFLARYPAHRAAADFAEQSVSFWLQAGQESQARSAREDYVARFASEARYQSLNDHHQAIWGQYSRSLADYYYAQGVSATGPENRTPALLKAADYFEALAPRAPEPGSLHYLAGDASLLAQAYERALAHYLAAAYEYPGEKSRDAAWAAIRIYHDRLEVASTQQWRSLMQTLVAEEHRYSSRFGSDHRISGLRVDLANRWHQGGHDQNALMFATRALSWSDISPTDRYGAWLVAARVHQNQGDYGQAENAWRQALGLVDEVGAEGADKPGILEQLATVIYRQAEQAVARQETDLAVAHFQRIENVLPGTEIAIRARFDGANTLLGASRWLSAINELHRFQVDYPRHQLVTAIGEKLILAYQKSGQPKKAAAVLLQVADKADNPWPARLRAAEIYHSIGDLASRNELYSSWLVAVPEPGTASGHLARQQIRHRLIVSVDGPGADPWRKQLLDQERASDWHSDETLRWAADAAFYFADQAIVDFNDVALDHPLASSLTRKRRAMEKARELLQDAASFGGNEVLSRVAFHRAELYRALAAALIASEVPDELNELETMQYRMLLEEQAYPLEEKALELHARNHQRIVEAGSDPWVERSLKVLADLYPARYQRSLRWMTWTTEDSTDV